MTHAPAQLGPFRIEVDEDGIAVVTFDRPPVNSVSMEVYEAIGQLGPTIDADDRIRVVILTAPEDARAWCGGADLNDFKELNSKTRKERYNRINELLPGLTEMPRPTIAAINAHAIGIGVVLASLCDMRVASEEAAFACREIFYGLVPGEGGLLKYLGLPQGVIREMLFTARRFTASEMYDHGFLNRVVPRSDVMHTAKEIASEIAVKSLPSLKALKETLLSIDGLPWDEAYVIAQDASTRFTEGKDASEGINAFLEGRQPRYRDN